MSYQNANLGGRNQAAEWEEKFKDAVFSVFRRWTVIQLIVDQEWAGRHSRNRVNQLLDELFAVLLDRRRPPLTLKCPQQQAAQQQQQQQQPSTTTTEFDGKGSQFTNTRDVEKLAEFLRVKMYALCETELEDDSDIEIATKCIQLLDGCRFKDYSLADKEIAAQNDRGAMSTAAGGALKACKFQDNTIYEGGQNNHLIPPEHGSIANLNGSPCGGDDDMDVDMDANMDDGAEDEVEDENDYNEGLIQHPEIKVDDIFNEDNSAERCGFPRSSFSEVHRNDPTVASIVAGMVAGQSVAPSSGAVSTHERKGQGGGSTSQSIYGGAPQQGACRAGGGKGGGQGASCATTLPVIDEDGFMSVGRRR